MDNKEYYRLLKRYKEPETEEEYDYVIKKLYRQFKRAYTVEEAKAIIEEIYRYKKQRTEMELSRWHSSV